MPTLHDPLLPEDRVRFSEIVINPKRRALEEFRNLYPDSAARLDERQKALRESRKARRKATAAQIRTILSMFLTGAGLPEIATAINRTPSAVRKIAAERGLPIVFRSRERFVGAFTSVERMDALARMAADRGASVEQTLEDLLTFALDEDALIARRVLHVRRRA